MSIDYSLLVHPEDERARGALEKLPGLNPLVTKVFKIYDPTVSKWNLASKIRLSRNQLPELYNLLPPVCEKLQIEEPEFYLEMNPCPNAYTIGDSRPAVIINSGLVEHLTQEELKVVIAHECGHILCRHVKNLTVARILLQSGTAIMSGLDMALFWSLAYWCRRTEFTADRVATWVVEDSEIVLKTLFRLTGGGYRITENLNLDEYKKQIAAFNECLDESLFDKMKQNLLIADSLHPLPAVRCSEILKWWNDPYRCLPVPDNVEWDDDDPNRIEWGK